MTSRTSKAVALIATVLTVAACSTSPALGPLPAPPAPELAWTAGPTPDVQTLVLPPDPLGRTMAVPEQGVELAVGAYLAKMEADGRTVHHLALLFQLDGENPVAQIDLRRGLLFEIDGAVYVGEAPSEGDAYHVTPTAEGMRLSMSFAVAPTDLERLVTAEVVRVRVGGAEALTFPRASRDRLRAIMDRVPTEAPVRGYHFLVAQAVDR